MSSKEEHDRRVAAFPADVRNAHKHSSKHREAILASTACGCFYCCRTYSPARIDEWIDDGQTALCPSCGIDSVIPDTAGFPLTPEFLAQMKSHWF